MLPRAHSSSLQSKGDLRAEAMLSEEQRLAIRTQPKGEISVPVTVTDLKSNEQPVQCEFVWAWVARQRPDRPKQPPQNP